MSPLGSYHPIVSPFSWLNSRCRCPRPRKTIPIGTHSDISLVSLLSDPCSETSTKDSIDSYFSLIILKTRLWCKDQKNSSKSRVKIENTFQLLRPAIFDLHGRVAPEYASVQIGQEDTAIWQFLQTKYGTGRGVLTAVELGSALRGSSTLFFEPTTAAAAPLNLASWLGILTFFWVWLKRK